MLFHRLEAPGVQAGPDHHLALHAGHQLRQYALPVVYIALGHVPDQEFPPWAFRSTNFEANMRWMNKPSGKLFMSIYENQTYLKASRSAASSPAFPCRYPMAPQCELTA